MRQLELFPIRQTEITLPQFFIEKKYYNGNLLEQRGNNEQCIECQIFRFGKDCFLAKNDDFEFYIAPPRKAISLSKDKCLLRLTNTIENATDIDKNSNFRWLNHPSQSAPTAPIGILQSWKDCFQFKVEHPRRNQKGLRRPQLGAVHAIAAYLSIRSDQPATVVMPTGTGKTETMLASLVYCQCPKVLVLVPSKVLRVQLFEKFTTLGCLPSIGVVPQNIFFPRVALIKKGIEDEVVSQELVDNSNVLIATPRSLQFFSDRALQALCDSCTHLFIDEAHHVAAQTWKNIKDNFSNKKIIQFTATPFRYDGKSLEGRVIYNYTLGEAQDDEYFKHIRLHSVEEYNERLSDEVIASEALEILRFDLENGNDHLLMARANSIKKTDKLFDIYNRLAPEFSPVKIHSNLNKAAIDEAFRGINNRSNRVIICADMLGEGFDLPNLKVAAIHDIYKSLAITLQFIGRFTRIEENVGDAAAVVNIADPKVEGDLEALYSENADWDKIIRHQSETIISREIVSYNLIESLKDHGDLSKQLSLWNLRPAFSALNYKTNCEHWTPNKFSKALPNNCRFWHAISQTENILVVVVIRNEEVKWGKYRDLIDQTYELLVAHWNEERNALFIHSSDYNFFKCESLSKLLAGDSTTGVVGNQVFRVFAGVERPLVRNLGAAKAGTISFTMYFGPNVTDGLNQVEKEDSHLSNLTGWGYENGQKVTWGCSQKKGKIWSVRGGPIISWREWCFSAWDKISDDSLPEAEITAGFLRPIPMERRYEVCPISVQWGEKLSSYKEERVCIFIGEHEFYLYEIDIEIAEYSENGNLKFLIKSENSCSEYELKIDSTLQHGYQYSLVGGPAISIKIGSGTKIKFEDFMVNDPVIFSYVDGSFSYNKFLVKVSDQTILFNPGRLEGIEWLGTNIRLESQGKTLKEESIQYKMCRRLEDEYTIIFDDDASGEAADIIAIRDEGDRQIKLCLVHCKFSSSDLINPRVNDFYALCGQAQKSIRWKHNGFNFLVEHMKKRDEKWHPDHTRFIKGNLRSLHNFKSKARHSEILFEVIIVQPGLPKSKVTDDILKLLASTDLFLKKTANSEFRVICSP